MHSANIRYQPAVDELRGIAALWVVIYHGLHLCRHALYFDGPFTTAHWPDASLLTALFWEGHAGVGLFMVLSGYIFTNGAIDKTIRYGSFLRNRLLRIYPLFVVLTVAALFSQTQPDWFGAVRTLLLGANRNGALYAPPWTDMFWTIAVEFQFYLVFPLLLLAGNRLSNFARCLLLALPCIARYLWLWCMPASARDLAYWTLFGRIDEFLLGMLIGYNIQVGKALSRRDAFAGLGAALCLLTFFLWLFNQQGGWPTDATWRLCWPLLEGSLFATLLFFYLSATKYFSPSLWREALRQAGIVSYSLYLTHMLVLAWLRDSLGFIAPSQSISINLGVNLIILVALSLLLASISYRLIERPFLSLRSIYFSSRRPPSPPLTG